MYKMSMKKLFYFLSFGLFVIALVLTVALPAQARRDQSQDAAQDRSERAEQESEANASIREKISEVKTKAEERRKAASQKLSAKKDAARMKRCEAKQAQFQSKFSATSDRAFAAISRIDERYERARGFAQKKGLTLTNAASLEADIATKKAAAQAAAESITTTGANFSCQNDDARAQAELVTADVAAYKAAIKDYRQSVKQYFGAVIDQFTASRPSTSATASSSPSTSAADGGTQ